MKTIYMILYLASGDTTITPFETEWECITEVGYQEALEDTEGFCVVDDRNVPARTPSEVYPY
jgi:hypothetical protein